MTRIEEKERKKEEEKELLFIIKNKKKIKEIVLFASRIKHFTGQRLKFVRLRFFAPARKKF